MYIQNHPLAKNKDTKYFGLVSYWTLTDRIPVKLVTIGTCGTANSNLTIEDRIFTFVYEFDSVWLYIDNFSIEFFTSQSK